MHRYRQVIHRMRLGQSDREIARSRLLERATCAHQRWVESFLGDGKNLRDEKWTKSIAVGNRSFVERVKSLMGGLAIGRKSVEVGESYVLRERGTPYGAHFEVKKRDIGSENTYFWDVNL